jgi:hypothetical protein
VPADVRYEAGFSPKVLVWAHTMFKGGHADNGRAPWVRGGGGTHVLWSELYGPLPSSRDVQCSLFPCGDGLSSIPKQVLMRILALAILALGAISAAVPAQAQTYDPRFPICMHVISSWGGAREDCSYYTMAQCLQTASGLAAQWQYQPVLCGRERPVRTQ